MAILAELERLVIPVACPGCGLPDIALCLDCAIWLSSSLRRVETQVPRLISDMSTPVMPVWALGQYTGAARVMVVAWKDKGREDLAGVFGRSMRETLLTELPLFPKFDLVIPMPSTSSSVRKRGRDHLAPVVKVVGRTLGAPVKRGLMKHASRDQVGLSARARGSAKITVRRWGVPSGARVLLFDDVVTTGATLAAAREALITHGCQVVGALVLAATPPRGKAEPELAFSTRLDN